MSHHDDLVTILETVTAVTVRHVTTAHTTVPVEHWFGPLDHTAITLGSDGQVALVYGNGSVVLTDRTRLLTPGANRQPQPSKEDLVVGFQRVLETLLRTRYARYLEQISN